MSSHIIKNIKMSLLHCNLLVNITNCNVITLNAAPPPPPPFPHNLTDRYSKDELAMMMIDRWID